MKLSFILLGNRLPFSTLLPYSSNGIYAYTEGENLNNLLSFREILLLKKDIPNSSHVRVFFFTLLLILSHNISPIK